MSRNKEIQSLACFITTASGKIRDVSQNVARVDLYESLYSPHLTGDLLITDNSNILSELPILGQERVNIAWRYQDKSVSFEFFVGEIAEIKAMNDNYGGYVIKLISPKLYNNTVNTFSRSYRGRNTQIIADVHADFLGQEVEVLSEGGTSHQIVFPYIKPYGAISMMLQHTYSVGNTPLFLYETVNSESVKMQSLADIVLGDSIELKNVQTSNADAYTGEGQRETALLGPTVDEQVIKRTHPTYKNIRDGLYASNISVLDLSAKYYEETTFNYKDHTPDLSPVSVNYIRDDFQFDDVPLHERYSAKRRFYLKDSKAYNSAVGNLYNVDSIAKTSMEAYYKTMNNTSVRVTSDPHPDLEVGKMLELRFNRMVPNLDDEIDRDPYRSGDYICFAIKHSISRAKYNLTIEAVRSGIAQQPED